MKDQLGPTLFQSSGAPLGLGPWIVIFKRSNGRYLPKGKMGERYPDSISSRVMVFL